LIGEYQALNVVYFSQRGGTDDRTRLDELYDDILAGWEE
jgi:hypothetical protein